MPTVDNLLRRKRSEPATRRKHRQRARETWQQATGRQDEPDVEVMERIMQELIELEVPRTFRGYKTDWEEFESIVESVADFPPSRERLQQAIDFIREERATQK